MFFKNFLFKKEYIYLFGCAEIWNIAPKPWTEPRPPVLEVSSHWITQGSPQETSYIKKRKNQDSCGTPGLNVYLVPINLEEFSRPLLTFMFFKIFEVSR